MADDIVKAKPAAQGLTQRQTTLKKFDDYFSPDNRQAFLAQAGSANGIDPVRVKAAVLNYVVRDEYLAACSPESVFDSVVAALQLGFIPSKEQGFAYLVPFKGVCTLICGYKGIMDLARRSGEIVSIEAFVVHANEVKNLAARRGTDGYFRFDPIMFGARGAPVGYVAFVKLKTGGFDFETMEPDEINRVRARSASFNGSNPAKSPWSTDYDQMALKTVLKRLLKRQPMAIEAVQAIGEDDDREFAEARDVTPAKGATQAEVVKQRMRQAAIPADTATVVEEAPPHDAVTGVVNEPVAATVQASIPTVEKKAARAPRGVDVSDPQTMQMILDDISEADGNEHGDEILAAAFTKYGAAKGRLSEQQKSNIESALARAGFKE